SFQGSKVLLFSILINFFIIPGVAYVLGITLLKDQPLMFAGLALSALLPTSGMTISWTVLHKGNVGAAVKLTVFGLILGFLFTPWYLLAMVGQYVEINILSTMPTILLFDFVPMILVKRSYMLILPEATQENFKKNIQSKFELLCIWAMLYLIFT